MSSTRTRTLSDNVNKETLGVVSLERKLCWTIVATQPCKSINTVVTLARFLSILGKGYVTNTQRLPGVHKI